MATIEELTSTIIADARAQSARIDDETHEEVSRIEQETAKMLAAQRDRVRARAEHEQHDLEQRALAKRKLEATQSTLLFKQQLIDETFASAKHALSILPPAKRRRLIHALHERVKRQMSIGSVIASKKDARSIKGARVGDMSGGFIAKSKDGKVTIDMRFDTLLADIKSRRTGEIARILFEERKIPVKPAKRATMKKRTTKKKIVKKGKR